MADKPHLSADVIMGNLLASILPEKSTWAFVLHVKGHRPTVISNSIQLPKFLEAVLTGLETSDQSLHGYEPDEW